MLMYLAIASRLTDHTHCRQVRWVERELVSGALSPADTLKAQEWDQSLTTPNTPSPTHRDHRA